MLANLINLDIIGELEKATNFLASSNQNELEVRMTDLPNTKLIPLTQGKFAIVDSVNYDFLNRFSWYHNSNNRVVSQIRIPSTDRRVQISIARLIVGLFADDLQVDHINGNTLDNRLENLRICTHAENMCNKKSFAKRKNPEIKYKGVSYYGKPTKKHGQKYYATIVHNYENIRIGVYNSAAEAAEAYDKRAIELHGEYAKTNKMLGLL